MNRGGGARPALTGFWALALLVATGDENNRVLTPTSISSFQLRLQALAQGVSHCVGILRGPGQNEDDMQPRNARLGTVIEDKREGENDSEEPELSFPTNVGLAFSADKTLY